MAKMKNNQRGNRDGAAVVEAALLLPLLITVWIFCYEVTHIQALKQQAQLLSSTAATRILESTSSFSSIEAEGAVLAEQLGLAGCEISITRIDSEIVEARVEIDYHQNSTLGSLLYTDKVVSTNYSYRNE